MTEFKFPAGEYYVGDLCYVMHDKWEEVCNLIIVGHTCLDGKFTLQDGTDFWINSTAYGDGSYPDNFGNEYGVDSGSIGIVDVSSLSEKERRNAHLGQIIEFDREFSVSYSEGTFFIGHIEIYTAEEEEEYEEEYDYGDDYDDE